jgi:hypothetical protein
MSSCVLKNVQHMVLVSHKGDNIPDHTVKEYTGSVQVQIHLFLILVVEDC